jgi:hypothetical protein
MMEENAEPGAEGDQHQDGTDETQREDPPNPRIEDLAEREGEGGDHVRDLAEARAGGQLYL